MTNPYRQPGRVARASLFLLVVLSLLATLSKESRSDESSPVRPPAELLKPISAVAGYLTDAGVSDGLKHHANYAGPPSWPVGLWDGLPPEQQLRVAYQAAEANRRGSGQVMLALLAKALAIQYDGVKYELSVKPLLELPTSPVTFADVTLDSVRHADVDPQARAAIDTIALYLEGSSLGGLQTLLQEHFGVTLEECTEILRNSPSITEALSKTCEYVGRTRWFDGMRGIVRVLDRYYDGARSDSELAPFRDPPPLRRLPPPPPAPPTPRGNGPEPGPDQPPPGGQGGAGGGSGVAPAPRPTRPSTPGGETIPGPDVDAAKPGEGPSQPPRPTRQDVGERYRRFYERNYGPRGSGGGGGFRGMRGFRGGFGGVVLGNDVTSDLRPRAIAFIADRRTANIGRLLCTSTTGRRLTFGPVLVEDLWVANAIVCQTVAGVPPWTVGDGIGLVGLESSVPWVEGPPNLPVVDGNWWSVVMHPAVAGCDIGRDSIVADAFHIADQAPESRQIATIASWLAAKVSTWKVTDAPIAVVASGQTLRLQRNDATVLAGTSLLLDTVGFAQSASAQSTFESAFQAALPQLVEQVPEFEHLNRFCALLAIIRWCKCTQVVLTAPPQEPALATDPIVTLVVKRTGLLLDVPAVVDPMERSQLMVDRVRQSLPASGWWDAILAREASTTMACKHFKDQLQRTCTQDPVVAERERMADAARLSLIRAVGADELRSRNEAYRQARRAANEQARKSSPAFDAAMSELRSACEQREIAILTLGEKLKADNRLAPADRLAPRLNAYASIARVRAQQLAELIPE